MKDVAVRVNGLCKSYLEDRGSHEVLSGVSLSVPSGQSLALRGRSGSGKSTLLNLLAGIDAADSGDVFVGTTHLNQLSERARTAFRRRHIGFVYQAFNLVPVITVYDNLRLMLSLNGASEATASVRVMELLDAVNLAGMATRFPDQLSGGEQQRVAVVRAVIHEPNLVLADEPTGNLDEASADQVLALLTDLVRNVGASLIMATHSHAIAKRCDNIAVLRNGQIVVDDH